MKPFFLLISILAAFAANAQHAQYFVYYPGKDTIVCKHMDFKTTGGNVTNITYTTVQGDEVEVKGKANCEKITCFSYKGNIYDLIPKDVKKPDEKRHMERVADGYIKVWYYVNSMTDHSEANNDLTVSYLQAQIGKEPPFPISKKNYMNNLLPLFQQCPALLKEFEDQFTDYASGVINVANYYNENCRR